ncbi:MAG TPA: ribonuclease H-like YkuK family protein [Candidatus Paceibacterota bacterium]
MEYFLNEKFFSPTKGVLSLQEVLAEMVTYMREIPHKTYEVIVGCDSSATQDPTFPVVIVVLRKQQGGRFFLRRVHYESRPFPSRRQRIMEEVMLSCQLALWLRENFATKAAEQGVDYEFKYIHADIGEKGITRDMVKEVTGLIRGNGFEPKIKPESFAASTVADRFS